MRTQGRGRIAGRPGKGWIAGLGALVLAPLLLGGCAGKGAIEAPTRVAESAARGRFQILQINDVYKIEGLEEGAVGGLARVRALRQKLEAEADTKGPVLVLHGGDLLFPSVMSKFLDARPMVAVLNGLDGGPGFDQRMIATFGNHEFDPQTPEMVFERLRQSEFHWLSSNVHLRGTDPAPPEVPATLVLDLSGVRVGIFGLTLDDTRREYVRYDYALEGTERSRYEAVRAALASLEEQGAEVIIALTHQELAEDVRLAQDFPQIHLVVGGHEHIQQKRRVGDTWITKADADARTAVVIQVDAGDPRGVVIPEPRWESLNGGLAKDGPLQQQVEEWVQLLADTVPDYTKVWGTTVHALEGEEPAIRGRETAMGNWLTDVVRQRLETDVAFIHGGSIRINDNIPAGGEIRGEHLEGIFYYDGNLVSIELTGQQLLDILANAVSRADAGAGRFLQVSGLRFAYRATGTPEAPSYAVDEGSVKVWQKATGTYAPLDPDATYTAATLEYLWEKGYKDGYAIFSAGDTKHGGTSPPLLEGGDPKIDWRGTTEASLEANGAVTAKIEGRIRRLGRGRDLRAWGGGEFRRQRRPDPYRLAVARMGHGQLDGVEEGPGGQAGGSAVEGVPHHRVSEVGQMHPHLMGPAGGKKAFHQGGTRAALLDGHRGAGGASSGAFVQHLEAPPSRRIATEGRCHLSRLKVRMAYHQSQIAAFRSPLPPRFRQRLEGPWVPGEEQHATGHPVQAVDQAQEGALALLEGAVQQGHLIHGQFPRGAPFGGLGEDPRGFVHRQQPAIVVQHGHRRNHRRRGHLQFLGGKGDIDHVAHRDASGLDPLGATVQAHDPFRHQPPQATAG